MRIERLACAPKQPRRHQAKHPLEPALSPIHVRDKPALDKVVLVIGDSFLLRAEAKFETPQPFVAQRCPAQVQARKSFGGARLDGFPHHEVVGPQMLKSIVGGAELIEGLTSVVEEHSSSHGPALEADCHYEPMPTRQHVPRDVLEEAQRLRRQPVPAPCPAVQCLKAPNRLEAVAEFHRQPPLRFADSAPHRPIQALEKDLLSPRKLDDVAVKLQRR